jgi:hypothetical protein
MHFLNFIRSAPPVKAWSVGLRCRPSRGVPRAMTQLAEVIFTDGNSAIRLDAAVDASAVY